MTLSELWVYPVKSLRGLAVQQWDVDDFGLRHDRRWLVVGADDVGLTQRDFPRMTLITPSVEGDQLTLSADGMSSLAVQESGAQRRVRVWNDDVTAEDCGPAAAEWLSDFLGERVSLVYMPDDTFRRIDPEYSTEQRRTSFTDGYPFLLISQESLDGLNARLEQPLEMRRFRPNLVVHGAPAPHAEDGWTQVTIGAMEFDVVKPCARCAVPTIDPATGIPGKEPSRTLATYRRRDGKVYFGQNLIHRRTGVLTVGSAATAEAGPHPA